MRFAPPTAAALVLASEGVAQACPACLGGSGKGLLFLGLGGLLSLVPFAVVAMVLYVLRHAPKEDRVTAPPGRPEAPGYR